MQWHKSIVTTGDTTDGITPNTEYAFEQAPVDFNGTGPFSDTDQEFITMVMSSWYCSKRPVNKGRATTCVVVLYTQNIWGPGGLPQNLRCSEIAFYTPRCNLKDPRNINYGDDTVIGSSPNMHLDKTLSSKASTSK